MNEEVYDRFGEGVILEKGPWKVRASPGWTHKWPEDEENGDTCAGGS